MNAMAQWTDGIVRHEEILRPGVAGGRLRRLGLRLWRAWGEYRAARAMRGLTPEMLKDIGVSFAEIDTVVRQGRPHMRRCSARGSRP